MSKFVQRLSSRLSQNLWLLSGLSLLAFMPEFATAAHWTDEMATVQCISEQQCTGNRDGSRNCSPSWYYKFVTHDGEEFVLGRNRPTRDHTCQLSYWTDKTLPEFAFTHAKRECVDGVYVFSPYNRFERGPDTKVEFYGPRAQETCLANLKNGNPEVGRQYFPALLAPCRTPREGEQSYRSTSIRPDGTVDGIHYWPNLELCEFQRLRIPGWSFQCDAVLVSGRPAGEDLIRVMIYVDWRGVEYSRNDIAMDDGGSCLH